MSLSRTSRLSLVFGVVLGLVLFAIVSTARYCLYPNGVLGWDLIWVPPSFGWPFVWLAFQPLCLGLVPYPASGYPCLTDWEWSWFGLVADLIIWIIVGCLITTFTRVKGH